MAGHRSPEWFWPFRIAGPDILTWAEGSMYPEVCLTMLDFLCDLLDRVPDGVWHR